MNEIRGIYRGYAWKVFLDRNSGRTAGWRGEWAAPTGEKGRTPLPLHPDAKAAEEAVIACIDEHASPTYTAPLEGGPSEADHQ